MADHDDGAAALGHLAHGLHHRHALAVIEAARGLVEQHHLGLAHHHARQRHHLALPAREREGRLRQRQAKAGGHALGALAGLGGRHALELEAKGDLIQHGVFAELAVGVLEKRGAVGGDGAGRHLARVEAGDAHLAGGRFEQAVQQLGEGGLAGAVLAHDAHELAGVDAHVEVGYRGAAVGVGEVDVREGHHGLGALGVRARRRVRGGAGGGHTGALANGGRGAPLPHDFLDKRGRLGHVEARLGLLGQALLLKAAADAGHARAVHAHGAQLRPVAKHLVGCAVKGDAPLVHNDHAAAELAQEGHLLLNHKHGDAQALVHLA